MAKADSKQKNVRLRNDVWFAVEDLQARWGCSRDMVLERAVEEAHGSGVDLSTPASIPSTLPASIPGVSVGMPPPKAEGGFPCVCEHTGCHGAKFMGLSKYAKMCPECSAEGHRGSRYECRLCADFGTGAL